MKSYNLKYLFSLCTISMIIVSFSSCLEDNFPHKKINIDEKYYLLKTERGYAFSGTVVDMEFYKRRSFWSDKSIGHIFLHWEPGVDSINVQYNNSSKLYNIYVAKNQKPLLDTSISF